MTKAIHRTHGVVEVIASFTSHLNVQSTTGIHQCHISELQFLDEAGQPIHQTTPMPVGQILPNQALTESVKPKQFAINTATPGQLSKAFPQLGKIYCQRIIERIPYAGIEDMVSRCADLFDNSETIKNLAQQLDFSIPDIEKS